MARSQPWGGATKGGTEGAEGVKTGSRVRNPTPRPPQNPTRLRCLSPLPLFTYQDAPVTIATTSFLLSLAAGQEWCTFLFLPPGSTLSPASPEDPDCWGGRNQKNLEHGAAREEPKRILGQALTQRVPDGWGRDGIWKHRQPKAGESNCSTEDSLPSLKTEQRTEKGELAHCVNQCSSGSCLGASCISPFRPEHCG